MSNIITKALKVLNEDYETLEKRVPGDPVINTVMGKAKEDAKEAAKAVEKVMDEVTPEKPKEPKMPKTKDLKDMGLQENYREYNLYDVIKDNEYFLGRKDADDDNFSFEGNRNDFNVSIYKMIFYKPHVTIYLNLKTNGRNNRNRDSS